MEPALVTTRKTPEENQPLAMIGAGILMLILVVPIGIAAALTVVAGVRYLLA